MKLPGLYYVGNVYRPSDDSWLAVDMLSSIRPVGKLCLDLGCGSGVLGIFALINGYCERAIFVDVDEDAVETTRLNLSNNGIEHRALVILSDSVSLRGGFADVVLANPPYLPSDGGLNDVAVEGGPMGYETALYFVTVASEVLREGGWLILVYSSLTGPEVITRFLSSQGFKIERVLEKAFFFETIFAVGCIKLG